MKDNLERESRGKENSYKLSEPAVMESEFFRMNGDLKYYLLLPLCFRDEEMGSEDDVIRLHC